MASLVVQQGSRPRGSLFSARDFRTFWLGQTIAMLGDQFCFLAFPWLVLQLTGNGLAMGTVLALMGIPRALLMLLGGALTDRFSPRTVLRVSTLSRLGLVSLLAVLTLGGGIQVWMLYAFALVFGVVDAFAYPAGTSILPRLVERDQLPRANALVQGTSQVAVFLGPVVAGAVIAALSGGTSSVATPDLLGIGVAFVVDACGFLVSSVTLAMIRTDDSVAATSRKDESVLASIRSGLMAVWHDAPLRTYFILVAGINLLVAGPFAVGLPILARSRLPEGVAALGIVMSAYGGGSLLGIVLGGTAKRPFEEQTQRLMAATGAIGAGLIFFGLSASTPLTAIVSALTGLANGYVVVQFMTWLQRRTPPAMLGRTMSLLMFSAVGLQPLSNMLAGAVADLHTTALFVGAGGLVILLVAAMATQPSIRDLRPMDLTEPPAEPVFSRETAA